MVSEHHDVLGDNDKCDCCLLSTENVTESYGCTERRTVLTSREQEVLGRIRKAAEKARILRKQIERYSTDAEEGSDERRRAEQELEQLRLLRKELEQERIFASEERMRLLGHA